MDVEEAIHRQLTTAPAVADLIGDKVYPDEAEPGATFPDGGASAVPYVVYTLVGSDERSDLSGLVCLVANTVEIEVYAHDKTQAKAIERAVADVLHAQTFAGVKRAYLTDRNGGRTDDGYESVMSFTVLQDGPSVTGE